MCAREDALFSPTTTTTTTTKTPRRTSEYEYEGGLSFHDEAKERGVKDPAEERKAGTESVRLSVRLSV